MFEKSLNKKMEQKSVYICRGGHCTFNKSIYVGGITHTCLINFDKIP